MANDIVCENSKTGTPSSVWDINGAGDSTIQGFATDLSVNQGGTVFFKINTNARAYTITIFRMGYYGGNGARQIATVSPSVTLPQTQPACKTDSTTFLYDCGNWAVSASWPVPSNATSGIYFAHIVRPDTGGDNHIVFIVRNDASHSDVLFQTADETWQAYNAYGGHSVYGQSDTFDLANRAYKVSYNRPFITRGFANESATWVFGAEYPMVRWLEANGYDVTYFTGIDAARSGSLIQNHKVYMDCGHDEYVSGPQRASIEAARDAGVNLAFFSGNEFFWKTRWENSIDGTNTAYRTMVVYKETLAFAKIDPADPPTWTGTWRDPSFSPPADGGRPENALTGTIFMVNGPGSDNPGNLSIRVPAADGKMRFWRNTTVANLAPGQTATLPAGTLGYEWDEDLDNGARPAGLFDLSTATYNMTADFLLDYGATYGAGTATHHMTMYRAPSRALVFGAGTVQWSWGLDSNHDNSFGFPTPAPSTDIQQATVNLFADMGIQPASLQAGLLLASKSTDTTPPTSTITFPTAGSTLMEASPLTITGTAADSGGGVVGGVEVSEDGGTTWHPASGRENWSYTGPLVRAGNISIKSRAVDDNGNLEIPSAGISVTVACPCSVWNSSSTPTFIDSADSNSTTLGVKFRADFDGFITGIRFYKASTNTGTHIGNIWTSTGTPLGSATFTNETGSGWQQVNFSSPIAISANTTYMASYFAPKGHYSQDEAFFATSGVDHPPLHLLAAGVDGPNGMYAYASSNTFPTSTYNSEYYWIDTVYTTNPGATWSISGTISPSSLGSGTVVTLSGQSSATVTADASGNYSFGGLANGSYTVTPAKTGLTFSPPNQPVTLNGASTTGLNFTVQTWTISGTAGVGSATVTLSGASSAAAIADSSGNYTFSGLVNGSYMVTPTKSGFTFTPASQSATVNNANVPGINFTSAAVPTYTISGTVSGAVASGVTLTLSGASSATAATDASGNYSFTGLSNGSYAVTPSKAGFTFTPASQSAIVNNANVPGINFTSAAVPTYTISGTVSGAVASGVTVNLTGASSGTTTTDGSGNYSFIGLSNGGYTVTPSKSGYTFTPANQSVTINNANTPPVNFTSQVVIAPHTPVIDAKVSADGNQASTITSPAFTTTSANELLLAFVATDYLTGANTTVTGVSGGGLTWALVVRSNAQSGSSEIWRAFATAPLSNVTVTATLSQSVISSITVMSFSGVDTSGTNGSGAIGQTSAASAPSGAPAALLTTTRNNSWVFGVGNDYDNAIARTAGTGQSLVHQYLTPTGDTYWVQMQNSPTPLSGTSVSINDTAPTGDRYNLSICEILPAP